MTARRRASCVLLLLGSLLSASVTSGAEEFPSSTNPLVLPFEFRRGHVMIPGRIAVTNTHPLMLDTGYSMTMLPPGLADALQLRRTGRVTIVGIAGEEEAGVFDGPSFEFGAFHWTPRRVGAFPTEEGRGQRREGILGSGFFRRFVVEINQRAKTVTLREPESFQYAGPGEILPLRFRRGGNTPIIAATLNDSVAGEFEIDTGCDSCLCLGSEFSKRHKLIPDDSRPSSRSGVGGGTRTKAGRLQSLKLGALHVERPEAEFFLEGSPAGTGLAGHLGIDTFRDFNLILDYTRHRLILEPLPARGKAPVAY